MIFPARADYAEVHHLVLIAISLYLLIFGPRKYLKAIWEYFYRFIKIEIDNIA